MLTELQEHTKQHLALGVSSTRSNINLSASTTNSQVLINAAIVNLAASGGGNIILESGNFSLSAPIIMRSGVSLSGVVPKVDFTANCPDLGWEITGGTVLEGDGTFDCFTDDSVEGGIVTFTPASNLVDKTAHGFSNGNAVYFSSDGNTPTGITEDLRHYVINATANTFQISLTSGGSVVTFSDSGSPPVYVGQIDGLAYASIKRLGIKNVKRCFAFGKPFSNGISFSRIEDIIVETCEDWVAELYMTQHLIIDHIIGFDVKRGIRYVVNSNGCAPGISSNYDCFLNLRNLFSNKPDYARRYGYVMDNEFAGGLPIDAVRWYSCQVNIYGADEETYTITDGDVNTTTDRITEAAHGRPSGAPIRFIGDDLPAPIVKDRVYFILNPTTNDFQLSTLEDLSDTMDITDIGSGTRTAYAYPGDTAGFVFTGADSSSVVNTPTCIACSADGNQNNAYRLENTVGAFLQVNHFPSVLHGERPVSLINAKYTTIISSDPDFQVFADPLCVPWFMSGIGELLPDSRNPSSNWLDGSDSVTTRIPCGSTNAMKIDATFQSFGVEQSANNTWPSISGAPCFYENRTTSAFMGRDRFGTTRYDGMAGTVVQDLVDVTQLAIGATAYIHNHDATESITLTTSGSQTINGSGTTRTIGPMQMAIVTADNRLTRTNWIVSIIAITTS